MLIQIIIVQNHVECWVVPIIVVSEQDLELAREMEVGRRGCGRGIRMIAEEGLREEIRILTTRLEAVEAGRRRDPETGDDSEEEVIATTDGSDGEDPEMRLLRSVLMESNKPKPELPNYDDSLSIEVLLD